MTAHYQGLISRDAGKRGGRAVVRGTRIAVGDVLDWLAGGQSPQEIIADFPELTREDVMACLAYAADRERRFLIAAE